jgi:polysaccharide deacetylase family protein (PEP-CTERM system associated)
MCHVMHSGITDVFTVDFEDWYHGIEIESADWGRFESRIEVGTSRLLDLLDEAHTRATFFILGAAAEAAPDLVREIARRGHEIGTHGYGHEFVYNLTVETFRADLLRSLEVLAGLVPGPILGYRAPYFSVTAESRWALDVLQESGIRYDSSVFPVRNYRYGIPEAPRFIHEVRPGLVELPPSTWRLAGHNLPIAGGAYFRLLPYTLTRFGLRRAHAAGKPAVFYLHPWELDPGHPRLPLPRRVALTHYHNLAKTQFRLRKLLAEFDFASASDVLADTVPGLGRLSE